jgi:hypothetical protein
MPGGRRSWFCEHVDHDDGYPVFHSEQECADHLRTVHPDEWDTLTRVEIVRVPHDPGRHIEPPAVRDKRRDRRLRNRQRHA